MSLSPIERMIDIAVGATAPKPQRWMSISCPHCGMSKATYSVDIDPDDAVLVKWPCGNCLQDWDCPKYYDANGQQIPFP